MSEAAPPQTNGDGTPTTPSSTPGAFPTTNGVHTDQENQKPAQPNKSAEAPIDAEACKAAGNKFFKAKQYDKAIEQYSKGTPVVQDCEISQVNV